MQLYSFRKVVYRTSTIQKGPVLQLMVQFQKSFIKYSFCRMAYIIVLKSDLQLYSIGNFIRVSYSRISITRLNKVL